MPEGTASETATYASSVTSAKSMGRDSNPHAEALASNASVSYLFHHPPDGLRLRKVATAGFEPALYTSSTCCLFQVGLRGRGGGGIRTLTEPVLERLPRPVGLHPLVTRVM